MILTYNQDLEPLVSMLISKASFLILTFYDLRMISLVIGSHNAMAQKATYKKKGLDPAYGASVHT